MHTIFQLDLITGLKSSQQMWLVIKGVEELRLAVRKNHQSLESKRLMTNSTSTLVVVVNHNTNSLNHRAIKVLETVEICSIF